MSSFQRIILQTQQSEASFKSSCNLAPLGLDAVNSLVNYFAGISGGEYPSEIIVNTGAVKASGTITSTGTAGAGETATICGITVTARASGAVENEFDVSADVAVQAANIAEMINESSDLAGIVTAEAVAGVVTVTAVVPGLIGNGLVMADVNLANVAIASFTGGLDGTEFLVIDQI